MMSSSSVLVVWYPGTLPRLAFINKGYLAVFDWSVMVRTFPCSHIDPVCTKEIFNILLIKSSIPVLIFRSLKIAITEVDLSFHMHLNEESGLSSCALSQ